MIWSGHGDKDGMWITNEEGKAELLPAEKMGEMFEDSGVQEMLLNVCNGGDKGDDALYKANIDSFSYTRMIYDSEGKSDAVEFATEGSLATMDTSKQGGREGGKYRRGKAKHMADLARTQRPIGRLHGILGTGFGPMGPFGPVGPFGPEEMGPRQGAKTPAKPSPAPRVPFDIGPTMGMPPQAIASAQAAAAAQQFAAGGAREAEALARTGSSRQIGRGPEGNYRYDMYANIR